MADSKPNFLYIIIDDMGVHQLTCYGNSFYETPNIDRLAQAGMRFTRSYATGPVCSPSRASIYTGKYPARLNLTNYIPGTAPQQSKLKTPPWTPYLPLKEATIGDLLKRQGYATGHFGKWHLGIDYNHRPGRMGEPDTRGFDEILVTRKPKPENDPANDAHNVRRITDRAVKFLEDHHDKTFACFVAHNSLHRPGLEHPDLVAKYAAKHGADGDRNLPVYAAMAETLDKGIGRLLDKLDDLGIADNTAVVFTSDHGAQGDTNVLKPLRGAKADLYEGGIRVPLLVRWPVVAAPESTCEVPVNSNDHLPTVAEITADPVRDNEVDGCSFAVLLAGGASSSRDALYWHYPHYHHQGIAPSSAILEGNLKLIEWLEKSIDGVASEGALELYDLGNDPSEQCDLADDDPQTVRRLYDRLEAWRKSVDAQSMKRNPNFDPADANDRALPPPGDAPVEVV
jgi:uncharacterized sulfatase